MIFREIRAINDCPEQTQKPNKADSEQNELSSFISGNSKFLVENQVLSPTKDADLKQKLSYTTLTEIATGYGPMKTLIPRSS